MIPQAPKLVRTLASIEVMPPLVLLGGCDALKLGFLDAAGPIAAGERHLFIVVSIVLISGYLLSWIDWRMLRESWRPTGVG